LKHFLGILQKSLQAFARVKKFDLLNSTTILAIFFTLILISPAILPGIIFSPAYSIHPDPNWAPCPLNGMQSVSYPSDPSANVTVSIIRIKAIDDFDPGFIFSNNQDFYGYVNIDGAPFNLPQIEGTDDAFYLPPKTFTYRATDREVPISIDIWDSDEGPDDEADINPILGKFDLKISFDLCSFQLSGDIKGDARRDITISGNGDGDIFGGHKTEITFRISTQDLRPLSSDDVAILSVDMIQTIPDASVLIQGKRTILTVIATNNFNSQVDTSIKVTIKSTPDNIIPEFSRTVPVSFPPRTVKTIYFLLDESFIPPIIPPPKSYFIDATVHIDPDGKLAPIDPKDCRAINDVVKDFSRKAVATHVPKLLWAKVGKLLDVPDKFATDEELSKSREFGGAFIRATYPISSLDISTSPVPIVPPASGVFDALLELLHAITGLPADSLTPFLLQFELSAIGGGLGYDSIMGVLRQDWFADLSGWGGTAGLSSIEMMPHGVIFLANHMTTPGHEFGHTFGLSVDPRMKGPFSWETFPIIGAWSDWDEYKLVGLMDSNDPIRMGNPASGYWLARGGEPAEMLNLLDKPVCNAHCMMGSLPIRIDKGPDGNSWATSTKMTSWIDAADYEHLIDKLKLSEDPRTVYLSGIITEGNITLLTDWYTHENGTVDIASGTPGPYSFIFLSKNGTKLSEVGFTPSFGAPEFNATLPFTPFGFNAELPNGTSKIQLWNRFEPMMLAERNISLHNPEVTAISSLGNSTLNRGQNMSIAWKSSDSDGDNLTYILALSDKSQKWFPLAHIANETQYEFNTKDLPAGKYAFKVIVTDGVNTAESSDLPFSIR
jgi:hypothetical protein